MMFPIVKLFVYILVTSMTADDIPYSYISSIGIPYAVPTPISTRVALPGPPEAAERPGRCAAAHILGHLKEVEAMLQRLRPVLI